MLSPIIRAMIEEKLGHDIRYPSDCEHLSHAIANATRQHVGVTTLKRLLGFVRGVSKPRMSTLDIIATYLGYRDYDELVASFAPSRKNMIERIDAGDIADGAQLRLSFDSGYLWLTKTEGNLFSVERSSCRQLCVGDLVRINLFRLHYPLFVSDVICGGVSQGGSVVGKVSGIVRMETDEPISVNC